MTTEEPKSQRPTSRQARDARRQAHEAEKKKDSDKGGDMKGKKGKGKRKP